MPNLNKYKAYKNVAENYGEAVEILTKTNLVLGEGAVVPYYKDQVTKSVKLLLGIGSLDGNVEIFGGITSDTSSGSISVIYYGSGMDMISVMQESIQSTTPFMTYKIGADQDGSFVYLAVPKSMPALRFELDNVISPTTETETAINGIPYIVYKTVETVSAGQHTLRVLNTVVENSIVLTVDPSLIRVGADTIVTFMARCTTNADEIVLYDASNNQLDSGSGTFLETSALLSPVVGGKTRYMASARFGEETLVSQAIVTSYLIIYYGSGKVWTDATNESQKATPSGIYKFDVQEDGDKLFFVIPTNIEVNGIMMSGFNIPIQTHEETVDGFSYTVYESTNGYHQGSYEITIGMPGDSPEPQDELIYYGSGQSYVEATSVYDSDTPKGVYNVTVSADGDYLFFLFPMQMGDITDITMSGYSIPMATRIVQMNNILYNLYQSTNQYRKGLYRIVVS